MHDDETPEHDLPSEDEHQDEDAPPIPRREELSPEEASLLRKQCEDLFAEHYEDVRRLLGCHGLSEGEVADLLQESFLALFLWMLQNGQPRNPPGMLLAMAKGKLLNYLRHRNNAPQTVPLPSSKSEPGSTPDLAGAVDARDVARRAPEQVTPDQWNALKLVDMEGLTFAEAAEKLGIPEGTLKTRARLAREELFKQNAPLVPENERRKK